MKQVKNRLILLRILLLLAAIFFMESPGVNAQPKSFPIFKGRVISSKDNQAIPNVAIVIKSTYKGTISDVNGYFKLEIPKDSITIILSSIGYNSKEIKVKQNVDLPLQTISLDEDIKSLDEVSVFAEKERIARVSENISSIKMSPVLVAKLPNMGEVDIMRAFQLLPGVSATNETSSGLFVRGGTPDQNLILFDGMTIYHVDHFYGFFSAFNASTIDDIELITGGFPANYGGRISSVMNITGKQADLQHFNGTATVSLLSVNGALEVPLIKDKLSLQVAGRRSYTDIIRTGLYNKIFSLYSSSTSTQQTQGRGGMRGFQLQNQQPDFYFYDLNSKLTYKINTNHSLAISVYSGKDNLDNSFDASSNFGGFGGGTSTVTNSSTDLASWGNEGISGQWKADWNKKFNSSVFVSYSNYFSNRNQNSGSTDSTGTFNSRMNTLEDNQVEDVSFRIKNYWAPNSNNTIEFGLENTSNHITYSLTFNDSLNMVDKNSSGMQSSVYLLDKINLFDKRLEMNLGIRATYQDLVKKIYYEPRASLTYTLMQGLKLKSAWGIYNQFCNRVIREDVLQGSKDFWLLADGETIPVSSASHYIAGLSYEKGDFLFNAETYYKDLNGLTEYTFRTTRSLRQATANTEYFFKGSGYARGIEFMLQKKYGLNTGWIAYTLSEVRNTFPDLNYGKSYFASHDQTNEFKAVYCRKIKNWDLSATFVYATGKPYTAPESQYQITLLDGSVYNYIHVSDKNSMRLPDYHKLDLAASYNLIGKKFDTTFSFSIFNAYNHKNIWYRKYDISEDEVTVTDVNYLGITPNISVSLKLK
jgi:hypothetical protein